MTGLDIDLKMTESEREQKITSLYEQWVRLGVLFGNVEPSDEEPQLERLIADTSVWGRYEPRLLDCMAGWIQKCGDLINIPFLSENLCYADSAVIGLISDVVTSNEAQSFKKIGKYCEPKAEPEMLFYVAYNFDSMIDRAILQSTEINRRWNLYYVCLQIKTRAIYKRQYVIQSSPELTRRAINLGIVLENKVYE